MNFYPRPPRGGRRSYHTHLREKRGISIHALREEGDKRQNEHILHIGAISIHALREEGDLCNWNHSPVGEISIHALREEGDWA